MLDKDKFLERFNYWADRGTGDGIAAASERQLYEAVSRAIVDLIWNRWRDGEQKTKTRGQKRAFYLSAEYLVGRALGNNLINLGLRDELEHVFHELNIDINAIEEIEPDPGLGSGGLGRLAACFMESSATLNLPVRGYGIRYRYGMFRQKIIGGMQVECPDDWAAHLDPWSIRRGDRTVVVRFGGHVISEPAADGSVNFALVNTEDVHAIPYDMPIIGWNTETINTLRLWEAESVGGFNLQLFNSMDYRRAVEVQNRAKDLSRVLYPNDSDRIGKELRLRQQFFFASASLQDIIREYKSSHGSDFTFFPDKAVVQLNDTHPVVAIPEFMRILLDEEGLNWDQAWNTATKTFAYTNHTVMAEALETWSMDLFNHNFPRLMQIIEEINRRFMAQLMRQFPKDRERHHRMSILADGMIKMAHLAIAASFSVNGVAALHTKILKTDVLHDWHELWPRKINSKTNGVTPRRWLKKANPELAGFLDEAIGPEWTRNLELLRRLTPLVNDDTVLQRLKEIKLANKTKLAKLTRELTGVSVNPASLFDIQIKRLHEYKRQLLNIISVIYDWLYLKDNPNWDIPPRTIFFGGKAASGYHIAKQIIHLIHAAANCINKDEAAAGRLKVVFIPDYRVSIAEILFPGAEISQQISTSGKEASGTGNMKFMMNGAITLGTMDGANIEIVEAVGKENAFIFGMGVNEIEALRESGKNDSSAILNAHPLLNRVLNTFVDGTLGHENTFRELYDSLVYGLKGDNADNYYVLADFDSYRKTRTRACYMWTDEKKWNKMALLNIAGSGQFSSDRTIQEYANEIWNITPSI